MPTHRRAADRPGRARRGWTALARTADRRRPEAEPLGCTPATRPDHDIQRLQTRLDGLVLIQPVVHGDERGFLQETYRREALAAMGVTDDFVQDNHSRSRQGVVRGMHFQVGAGMAKLIRCGRGSIFDVVVDVRVGSPTFGHWEGFPLDDRRLQQLYVPIGFAHGFCVTSDVADVMYKCSVYYDPALERGIRYDDPDVGIEWPDATSLVSSERDAAAPLLRELEDELPFRYRP